MRSSIIIFAATISVVSALPAPQTSGAVPLGGECSSSSDCANGANCYAVNSGLIPTCGNFQASCTSDSQCAFNTCVNGACNGFLSSTTTTTSTVPQATGTIALGAQCSASADCANGAGCYAVNSGLIPTCGNFQASCTTNSQCAFNTCVKGLCNGFLSSTTTSTTPQATGTIALGAQCSASADCANGAGCYAVNSGLIPTCGNFQASCTTDSQCAFNTCVNGLCNGFLAPNSTSTTTTISAPQATTTSSTNELPLGSNCTPASDTCANGASCYATNSMLQPRCGNFAASCSSDSQCAFNACNTDTGLCTGFLASSMTTAVSSPTPSAC